MHRGMRAAPCSAMPVRTRPTSPPTNRPTDQPYGHRTPVDRNSDSQIIQTIQTLTPTRESAAAFDRIPDSPGRISDTHAALRFDSHLQAPNPPRFPLSHPQPSFLISKFPSVAIR